MYRTQRAGRRDKRRGNTKKVYIWMTVPPITYPEQLVKKALIILWLLIILGCIGGLFWYTDWKYSLPTPLPAQYHPVARGVPVALEGKLDVPHNKPVFLHFFNPDCPCSRFNIPSFKALEKKYGDQMTFAIVVLNNNKYTARQIQNKFELDIPVSFDSSVAAACGVYSTPQAVVLDVNRRLYYRGNYNKSRYCTDTKTNFAQMAIDSLFSHASQPVFSAYALKAYGCQLPACTQN
jgi:thiol-disulfide isomerase/thioredoxin